MNLSDRFSSIGRAGLLAALLWFAVLGAVHAQAALNGATGLINMPSARMEGDGTLRFGLSHAHPYLAGWASLSALSFLEATARYTRVSGVPGLGPEYGSLKDKSIGGKLQFLREGAFQLPWMPSLAVGGEDPIGTGIFRSEYVVASKQIGDFDVTGGYGRKRIDGVFGGVRWSPQFLPKWSVVAEYDRTRFLDPASQLKEVQERKVGSINAGVEYNGGWWRVQIGEQYGRVSANAYFVMDLHQAEYQPKVREPLPYASGSARLNEAEWLANTSARTAMFRALEVEGLRGVRIRYAAGTLKLEFESVRHQHISRAVGRAARIALAYAPIQTERLEVTYRQNDVPVVEYVFWNVKVLERYLNGTATRADLSQAVTLKYPQPWRPLDDAGEINSALQAAAEAPPAITFQVGRDANLFGAYWEGRTLNSAALSPYLRFFFNDPSGAFKYELGLDASGRLHLGKGLFAEGGLRWKALENVSDVTQPSNSVLPRVRTDIALYFQEGPIKLDRLLLNQYLMPSERVWARVSGGLYEEMFGGVGGQVLYVPRGAAWAADVSMDWVRQRNFSGWGFLDYSTVTALASVNVKLPYEVVGTVRAGRFLAKDEGARVEFKRFFGSGIAIGAWYSKTNGRDITNPGSPSNPYNDKGVFISIPLGPMLPSDSKAQGFISIAPWTRDVAQMVVSPGDLYSQFERGLLRNVHDGDGLNYFHGLPGAAK